MNGQNPNNNQLNQGNPNVNNGINASVLGSVSPNPTQATPASPTPGVNVTPTPVVNTPNVAPQQSPATNVTPGPTPGPQVAQPNLNTQTPPVTPTGTVTPNMNAAQPQVNTAPNASVAPQPTPTPATPASSVTPEPVAQPIPGTSGTPYQANSLTGNTVGVGTPTMGQDNLNSNGFVEPNKAENIGIVPPLNNPTTNEPKKKKGMNKTLFVVLIIVAIAAVAFGVYYFLSISNKVTVNLKEVTIGVGDTLSDNISDYATISGKNAGSCTLNIRNVDTQTIGTYNFTITCGDESFTGTVNVSDTTAPEVSLNTLYKVINSTATIDEFVASCTDPSECTTAFANENTLTSYLATAGGPYSIEITATDNAGNSGTYNAQLYVTPYDIRIFKNCESTSSEVSGYQATKTVSDYLPMGNNDTGALVYLGVSQRIYTYVFTNADEYNSVVGDKPQTLTFDSVTGQTVYDDDNLTFQITTDLSLDTLNTEAGGTFPTSYADIDNYYKNLSYTCNNVSPAS